MSVPALLRAEGVTKRFPGVLALDRARLELRPGEIHGLVGENGAGKSTLVNIISGALKPDAGELFIGGLPVSFRTPNEAHSYGIRVVYQHLSLVPQMSVAENLFLGREAGRLGFLARREMHQRALKALEPLGEPINPQLRVRELSPSNRYLVEIAKAMLGSPVLLVFDEPTASLTNKETERLYEIARKLRGEGRGILWITHRLEELEEIADRATVMRDGRYIVTLPKTEIKKDTMIKHMIGRDVEAIFPAPPALKADAPARLEVENIATPRLDDVSFTLKAGEILGVGGLVGAGSSRLGRALFGLEPLSAGSISLDGQDLRPRQLNPSYLTRQGVVYLPADRLDEGVVGTLSASKNMTLSSLERVERLGFLSRHEEHSAAQAFTGRLSIRPDDPSRRILNFSGGNQQKVLLARGMFRQAKLFIIDEPTQGIDVGAKSEVYDIIGELAEGGAAILVISSDTSELLNACHRIMVFHEGRVSAILNRDEASEESLLQHYFGLSNSETGVAA